jgi:uncharacterized membrane protein
MTMTIKRQIFHSNLRTVLVTLFGLLFVGFVFQLVLAGITGVNEEDERAMWEQVRRETEYEPQGWMRLFIPVFLVSFVTLITAVNNLLNYRLMSLRGAEFRGILSVVFI